MRSVGVTAMTLSTQPATMPARIPLPGVSLPLLSARMFRIESNDRNRTPALKAVPCHDGQSIANTAMTGNISLRVDSQKSESSIQYKYHECHPVLPPG
jgi:hypothetical protein